MSRKKYKSNVPRWHADVRVSLRFCHGHIEAILARFEGAMNAQKVLPVAALARPDGEFVKLLKTYVAQAECYFFRA